MPWGDINMKPTFLTYDKPLLTAMIQCPTPNECIEKIQASLNDGAEAFGIQLCRLKRKYRTKEILKSIFNACGNKPIYVTSYKLAESADYTYDDCAKLLLLALDSGATLCDVMGDMFSQSSEYQLTNDITAIEKQKKLIDKIHFYGGEVLISSHTFKSTTVEENLMIAKAQIERGADIIKIVNTAKSINEIPVYIESIQKITQMTDKKLLFLVSGQGQIIRYIGPHFGVCMYLCVQSHNNFDTPEQPILKKIKAIRDNMPFDISKAEQRNLGQRPC